MGFSEKCEPTEPHHQILVGAKQQQHSNFPGFFSQIEEEVTLQGDVARQKQIQSDVSP